MDRVETDVGGGRLPPSPSTSAGRGRLAPGCTTGALLTIGVHWIRRTHLEVEPEAVAKRLGERFGWDVEQWDGGRYFYDQTLAVGPLRVYFHPGRPEMGVCIDAPGEACEQIGTDGCAWVLAEPGWTTTRVDVAIDGCPFEPATVRDSWRAGDVRTAARYPKVAKPGREGWRTSEWGEYADGDMFRMGSRQSEQFVRCYDRRGSTRVELELKGETAAAASAVLAAYLEERDELAFTVAAVGLLRRFVDFVDASADSNISRAPLLGWWAALVEDVERMRLWRGERVAKSVGDMLEWALRQAAPTLAVLERVFGPSVLRDLAKDGRSRWRRRHLDAMRMAVG